MSRRKSATAAMFRHILLALLLFGGVLHLLLALFNATPGLNLYVALIGAAMTVASFFVRSDVKDGSATNSRLAAAAAAAIALAAGAFSIWAISAQGAGSAWLLLLLIQAMALAAALFYLLRGDAAGRRPRP